MVINLNNETEKQITECLNLIKSILGTDLLGAYLYGSTIVGGLQKFSDIDLFIVSDRATTYEEKNKLATNLLTISGVYMKSSKRPIEMTLVVKSDVNPWYYPPSFDFQYGDWLRQDFTEGNIEPWPMKEMPDLAILITQVLLVSETLFGPKPGELLCKVPYQDFIMATEKEIDSLMANINCDTRNVLLAYGRIWSTLETDAIHSKVDAAIWVVGKLPKKYQPVIKRAKAICAGEENEYWDDIKALIQPCADFMLNQIKEQILIIKLSSHTNKSIKLAGPSIM